MTQPDSQAVSFGPFRLELGARRLTRHGDGVELVLGGRAFDTLATLAAAVGQTVSKDALLAAIWPDLVVEENNLQVQISGLRKVLGESWIVTVPGRGYRLVLAAPEGPPAAAGPPPLPDRPSIAVMPFVNLSGDPEQEYFADGMTEEIMTVLSRIQSFFVVARNSSFTYKGRIADIVQVGRELGVRYVVQGSVRKSGTRVRISGQLADANSGTTLWADRFDGALDDVFSLQDRVTGELISAIGPRIRAVEIERARRKPPGSLAAYDLVLRALPGLFPAAREGMSEAETLLRSAVVLDPHYAYAHVMLAYSLWLQATQRWRGDMAQDAVEIRQHVRTALSLAPDDSEVLAYAGFLTAVRGGDVAGGITLLERALVLNPSSVSALGLVSQLYGFRGDVSAAIDRTARAMRLSPLGEQRFAHNALMLAHFEVKNFEGSLAAAEQGIRHDPNRTFSWRYKAACLALLGRVDEAKAAAAQMLRISPTITLRWIRDVYTPGSPPGEREYASAAPAAHRDNLENGLRRAGIPEG
jgi:TolB-like protein/tetratricopeptide (TPR) repeat protein